MQKIQTLPGINSAKFLDITKIQHRFPEQLNLGIPLTLLHNHLHCPTNYVLVYQDNFTRSTYRTKAEAEVNYHECSWFFENNQIIAYEYCDVQLTKNEKQIQQNLELFENRGLFNYGTTLRPIRKVSELDTQKGHIYLPVIGKIVGKYSETATDGKKVDACKPICLMFAGSHYKEHFGKSSKFQTEQKI